MIGRVAREEADDVCDETLGVVTEDDSSLSEWDASELGVDSDSSYGSKLIGGGEDRGDELPGGTSSRCGLRSGCGVEETGGGLEGSGAALLTGCASKDTCTEVCCWPAGVLAG